MVSLTTLTLVVGLIHVGLGGGVIIITYRLLETSFGAAVPVGLAAGGLVIGGDWIVGKSVMSQLHPMTLPVVEQLVISAAVGAMIGLVGFSLLFQPEEPNDGEGVATW